MALWSVIEPLQLFAYMPSIDMSIWAVFLETFPTKICTWSFHYRRASWVDVNSLRCLFLDHLSGSEIEGGHTRMAEAGTTIKEGLTLSTRPSSISFRIPEKRAARAVNFLPKPMSSAKRPPFKELTRMVRSHPAHPHLSRLKVLRLLCQKFEQSIVYSNDNGPCTHTIEDFPRL